MSSLHTPFAVGSNPTVNILRQSKATEEFALVS